MHFYIQWYCRECEHRNITSNDTANIGAHTEGSKDTTPFDMVCLKCHKSSGIMHLAYSYQRRS